MGVSAPNKRGVVQQAVEPAVALLDGGGDGFVVRGERAFEVERHDAGFGAAERGDFRVHGFELAHRAAEQDDFGAGRGQRQRDGAADAGTGAGDHDDAALKFVGRRLVRARIESSRVHGFRNRGSQGFVSRGFVGFGRRLPAAAPACSIGRRDGRTSVVAPSSVKLARLRHHVAFHRSDRRVE